MSDPSTASRVQALLAQMTLAEKVGQLCQVHASENDAAIALEDDLRAGRIGSVINNVDVAMVNHLQTVAVEQSRLGIPLLIGRDVIHGFKTVMPIPLGQAASWNSDVVRDGATIAAREAAASAVNWTFAPMVDIARDARWGRIAECLGEDPYLASLLAQAMVQGFQGDDLADASHIAACAKHFAGYGESESGRDYATTNIPENELRNVHLRPFHAAVQADVKTLMTSFSDLDGIPATANDFLLRQVLREEWDFQGFVVSDWDSVRQLSIHGLTENDRESAFQALSAGVDMEMAGDAYRHQLPALLEDGVIDIDEIDRAVARVLSVKFELGLFERYLTDPQSFPPPAAEDARQVALEAAAQSLVLLKNSDGLLPLSAAALERIAVIGPLADAPHEQLGTWIFDGDASFAITPLQALRERLADRIEIVHVPAMAHSRARVNPEFDRAFDAAANADVALLVLGEESILSGEAHSRANIDLPGDQVALVQRIRAAGTPVVAVIMAGRPLTLGNVIDDLDALIYAWHPGTMGGPAIVETLLGERVPAGKLPVTFPSVVGQIPIYYNQKPGGKPPTPNTIIHIDEIDPQAPQTSFGMTAFHLDAGYRPLFPFGFGLSYTQFVYSDIRVDRDSFRVGEQITISATLRNDGAMAATEIAQLYVRDRVGSITRPVRELKGFQRHHLAPGESMRVSFLLSSDDLAFFGRNKRYRAEPGQFHAWIGGDSDASLQIDFRLDG